MWVSELPPLKPIKYNLASESETVSISADEREAFIAKALKQGGRPALESIRKYGVNEKGESIRLTSWYEEVILLVADFRIGETWVTGCSQLGKTLVHTLSLCHYICVGGLSAMWAYDMQASRDIQVKANFWPVIQGKHGNGGWIAKQGLKRKNEGAAQNINLYQVGGGEVQFPYVSTSKKGTGSAAAGGIAVGVSRDFLIREEYSQYEPGAGAVLDRRLDASRIPTRPMRNNGTPGGGLGIELDMKKAKYHFYPHCVCDECSRDVALDPFGSLLKPVVTTAINGDKEETYLSEAGRPIDWFHHDALNPIETAYFGCPHCNSELSGEARKNAWYQCLKTGVRLRDYLSELPAGIPKKRQTAALEITPLLRIEKVNTAERIIDFGLTTENTDDFCQQMLGKPSERASNGITQSHIRRAIEAPRPKSKCDITIAGVDQARKNGDHVWIQQIWLPDGWEEMPIAVIKESAIRYVNFCGLIKRSQLLEFLTDHQVTYGLIDNEPEITDADKLSKKSVLEPADQRSRLDKAQFVADERESGGDKFNYWKIRQRDFQADVLKLFTITKDNQPLVRLPDVWREHLAKLSTETSPARHLLSMSRDRETMQWERPEDHNDDSFFAAMFAEAAFSVWLSEQAYDPRRPLKNISIRTLSSQEILDWAKH